MFEARGENEFDYQLHGGSSMRLQHHFGGNTGMAVAIQTWIIPPGGHEGFHAHDQDLPLEEFYQVIEGSAKMRVGDQLHLLNPGDSVLAPSGVPHDLKNIGQGDLRMLVVWGPPASFDLSSFGSHRKDGALRNRPPRAT
ncbi:cupin domain-containing protein [Glutamicibacter sp. V16R2B1]|uniref:cupin domain-containing protein n=1 Tax=Glutamicibacter sp. V16R2B1 TaxID=2036207 RepID=UPI0010FE0E9F|nr:cupin domain-containing protein [Glutamicibacter sp. V16R2B1]TLK52898.1 cupin domain-containing protein [Glutamicibacter sp. V16R2B1]